jgi:hypothetical protein
MPSPMDKKNLAKRLQALATADQNRSKAARLRDVLEDVERALAAGAKRTDVLAELEAQGLPMSLATFETTLKRLRAKRRVTTTQSSSTSDCTTSSTWTVTKSPVPGGARTQPEPSHDPADVDRIIATQPDLVALARLANRSRK